MKKKKEEVKKKKKKIIIPKFSFDVKIKKKKIEYKIIKN